MQSCSQQQHVISIIPDRLTWILSRQPPRHREKTFCFNTEEMLVECNNRKELEPPSLLVVARFAEFLSGILSDPKYQSKQIFYHSTLEQKQKLNTCFLVSTYEIVVMGRTPEEVMARYKGLSFINYGSSTSFSYTLLEALKSIYRTYKLGLFSFDAQRLSDYERYRDNKEGAITMLIPGKLVVFQWLKGEVSADLKKFLAMSINKYSKALSHFNVTELVRILVEEEIDEYDIGTFKKYGFRHSFLTFYQEPSFGFFQKAIAILEKEGIYAICSQDDFGLSVLVACTYVTKKYGLKPVEVIPWMKMMIPGCLTPKQMALYKEKYEYMVGFKTYITINNWNLGQTISIHEKLTQS